ASVGLRFQGGMDMARRAAADSLVFAFSGADLVGRADAPGQMSTLEDLRGSGASFAYEPIFVGTLGGRPCFAAACGVVSPQPAAGPGLRDWLARDEAVGLAAGRAWQLNHWCLDHAFCGRCGAPTEVSAQELCRVCPSCGNRHYPRVTPAVIVRVERGYRILLAHRKGVRSAVYSLLAGFVEPGENLEEAVAREVLEEVSIELQEIHYAASQPWPFPGQLMVGFAARSGAGDAVADGVELDDARWFGRGELPDLPPPYTLSRRLIDQFAVGA
ncbi:MAG: NAD(+) diphosphatase, partial [Candidatus Dormibacterales bacterium]